MFEKPLDGALFMLRKGFKVFPLKENAKTPAFTNWQEWAIRSTEKRVSQYGTANPMHNWGVYCEASELAVVDLDTKKDKDGIKTIREITKASGGLPKTFSVKTPSNGLHLYYKGSIKSSVSSIGPGIDTRGYGGYVVAPGSRINERSYEVKDSLDILPYPDMLVKLTPQKEKPEVLKENQVIEKGVQHKTLVSLAGSMRRRGMGYDAINAALQVINAEQLQEPAPIDHIEGIARRVCKYTPEASDFVQIENINKERFSENEYGCDINFAGIPKRKWVMENRSIKGYVSLIIAPGGIGKSTFSILDALSICTGKSLTGEKVVSPGKVWLYNMEDPKDELRRRICAAAMHHGIKKEKLKNIIFNSGISEPFRIAIANRSDITINDQLIQDTINYIKKENIQSFIVDPFVRSHSVDENSNMQIDHIAQAFQQIAELSNCAVTLVHHTRKKSSKSKESSVGDPDQARGASSLVNAARVAHTISGMAPTEALTKFGIDEEKSKWYIRLDSAKANLQAPSDKALWFKKISVDLFNGESAGTLEKADVDEFRKQKTAEMCEMEKEDVAACLSNFIKPGEIKKLKDISNNIKQNKEQYSHLFGDFKEYRTPYNKILKYVKNGLQIGKIRYETLWSGEAKATRLECKRVETTTIESEDYEFLS